MLLSEEKNRKEVVRRALVSWTEERYIMLPGDESDAARSVEIWLNNWQHARRVKMVPVILRGFTRFKCKGDGWVYTPWTARFGHGGWLYLNPSRPVSTLRFLWRYGNAGSGKR